MTETEERRAIRMDYDLTASREKVWRALTEPALLEQWLMPNDIAPVVGHRFTFKTQPAPGFDGIVYCEVIEADEPRRLVYTWRGGPIDTVVSWELAVSSAGGTRLSLVHDGFGPEHGFTYDMLERGWRDKAAGSLERVVSSL